LTNDNRIEENAVNDNNGWGMQLTRPNGTAPLTGNVIVQNRAHGNQRSGIALMGAAKGNSVLQNDARANNLSGLPPCVHCNLVDLSTGPGDPNVFERNLGTFNLTDPACLKP
jgi:parallel beta-helix repeat protein